MFAFKPLVFGILDLGFGIRHSAFGIWHCGSRPFFYSRLLPLSLSVCISVYVSRAEVGKVKGGEEKKNGVHLIEKDDCAYKVTTW